MSDFRKLFSENVVIGNYVGPATIEVENGLIRNITRSRIASPFIEDYGTQFIMPGIIDPHVHINEPGRTEWEGFETGTMAAAAGGITTIVDMPLNSSPVTINKEAFHQKLLFASGKLHIHCGFWGGIVPGNLKDLDGLLKAGVLGLKGFMTHSGIDEFPGVGESELREALKVLKDFNLPLLSHAEIDSPHEGIGKFEKDPGKYMLYLQSRPREWENTAIRMLISLCEETGSRVHIVHLSSSDMIPEIAAARSKGLPLTVETCPQYLFFDAESIPDNDPRYKCAPPIREKENNDQLWKALKDGVIDYIASDHSPAPPEIKKLEEGNLKTAWGGIAGLQFSLPVVWTAAQKRGFTLADVSRWMSKAPGEFLQLNKGEIKVGYDADLIVFDAITSKKYSKEDILHRHKETPYTDYILNGLVTRVFLKGEKVYEKGKFLTLPKGEIIKKNK